MDASPSRLHVELSAAQTLANFSRPLTTRPRFKPSQVEVIRRTILLPLEMAASTFKRYPKHLFNSAIAASHTTNTWTPPVSASPVTPLWTSLGDQPAVSWLGHCSCLLRLANTTILTDPVFSERIGMKLGGKTWGVPRLDKPVVAANQLPQIDLILLSHAHFDHLDRPTLQALARSHQQNSWPAPLVITAKNTKSLIMPFFQNVRELSWNAKLDLPGLTISAIQPRHWGARSAWDRHRRFNSYLIESQHHRVLFGGDTALTTAFNGINADLSILGIGAYRPWEHQHATPEQAFVMFRRAARGPQSSMLPVHFGTYPLGDEPAHEPLERLLHAASTESNDRLLDPTLGRIHFLK